TRINLSRALHIVVTIGVSLRLLERAGLDIRAQHDAERERRRALSRLRRRHIAPSGAHADHHNARGDEGRDRDEEEDTGPRGHPHDDSPAIQSKAMASYRDLLQTAKSEIEEADAKSAQALLDDGAVLVDVRERDEWEQGRIPGAVHVPRGYLEQRIEQAAPDRSQPVVLYCAAGNRSAFAAKTLADLGYERPVSLVGGYTDWQR